MRAPRVLLVLAVLTSGSLPSAAIAQTRTVSDAECQALRARAAEHAKVSEGVRKLVAGMAPATAAAPAPAATPAPAADRPASGVDAIRCQDMPGALEAAVKTRQKELGAREGQAGAVRLLPLQGQDRDQITRELAAQFAAWPEAGGQVGLLDQDANGQVDGFVDVPVEGVFRLVRQRSDGTLSVEAFSLASAAAADGQTTRRLEETALRQGQRTLADLLGQHPAGAVVVTAETRAFAAARTAYLTSTWADAGKIDGGAVRTREYENLRGEKVRALELIGPAAGGIAVRQVVTLTRGGQDLVEETTTLIRPVSSGAPTSRSPRGARRAGRGPRRRWSRRRSASAWSAELRPGAPSRVLDAETVRSVRYRAGPRRRAVRAG